MIAFGGGAAPPPLASISSPFREVDFSDLPAIDTAPARHGTPIAFRVYSGTSGEPGHEGVVVAIHGSSVTGTSLHPLAKAISAAGWTVCVPDIRGHGTTDCAADLRKAPAPISVLVGGADELFFAERYSETVKAARPDASVAIVPGIGHIAMTIDKRALAAIVATIR